jgi:transcriptional regulator with XRE-family HTH domain
LLTPGVKEAQAQILHVEPFFAQSPRGILSYMERKPTYIRAWRKKRGYALEEMVGRLDVLGVPITAASLSRIERGIQPCSLDTIEAIAEALGVESWQLLKDNPDIPTAPVADFIQHLDEKDAAQAEAVLRAMFEKRA